jgi:hypothetical protein
MGKAASRRKPKSVPSPYERDRKNCDNKRACNDFMARLALAGYSRAMVLDTSEFGTTRRLIEANPGMHVICPQINPHDLALMAEKRGSGPSWANVRVVPSSMSDALETYGTELSAEPFIIWRDGTSWWETAKRTDRSAQSDFEAGLAIFAKSSAPHAVIAMTVSLRAQRSEDREEIHKHMTNAVVGSGVTMSVIRHLHYGNMYFVAVELSRYGAPVPYKKGDRVSVLWPSDTVKKAWKAGGYDGIVDSILGRLCRVMYMENGVARYDEHSLAELRPDRPIAVGDRVGVKWAAGRAGRRSWDGGDYTGVVARIVRGKCYVDYDDGETDGVHAVADVRRVM